MNRVLAYIGTLGVGAAGIYLLDPRRGARRRNALRERLVNGVTKSSDGVTAAAREMAYRMEGMLAETRARLGGEPVGGMLAEAHDRSANASSLDDSASRARGGTWLQANWPPALRVVTGAFGAALLGYAAARRDSSTTWLGFIGAGLLMRAARPWIVVRGS